MNMHYATYFMLKVLLKVILFAQLLDAVSSFLILMQHFEDVSWKPWCLLCGALGRHQKIWLRKIMISSWLSANAFYKMLCPLSKRKWQIIFGNLINAPFLYCCIYPRYFLEMDKDQHCFSEYTKNLVWVWRSVSQIFSLYVCIINPCLNICPLVILYYHIVELEPDSSAR